MKLNRKTSALLLALGTGLVAGGAQTAQAVTSDLSVGFQATLASEGAVGAVGEGGPYRISVNPNNLGYAGLAPRAANSSSTASFPFQRPFTEAVQGYSFVGGGTNNVLTIAQQSGGLITYTTTDLTFDSFGQNQRQLWTTNDPGSDLLNPVTAQNTTGPGYRSFGDITATVDISALGTGTVNIFYGSFNARPTVSVVMRDLDGFAPDLVIANAHLNGDSANRAEYYIAEVDFVNDGNYDVIQYTYLGNGVDNTGNGRFGGTVLTGSAPQIIPEPATASLALIGLGGLMIRRRRAMNV